MEIIFRSSYYWAKTLHICFVVAWMAGLLYLPRLFVYHQENILKKEVVTVFKTMEYRLYYYIMTPSLILVWSSGLYLGYTLGFYTWLILKIGFVFLMTIYHFILGSHLTNFKNDNQNKSSRYFRLINEIPFLILFIIIILVVFKPFD
tara:strand:+ start:1254 stop:1694 length:441 start_codon:yes stop_codon:yes gene_type:complete